VKFEQQCWITHGWEGVGLLGKQYLEQVPEECGMAHNHDTPSLINRCFCWSLPESIDKLIDSDSQILFAVTCEWAPPFIADIGGIQCDAIEVLDSLIYMLRST